MSTIRTEKVGSEIKRILSSEISKLANENSAGFASISTVKVSKDLSIANIYFNLLASKQIDAENFTNILNKNKGHLRSILAQSLKIRNTPDLRFYYDDTLEVYEATQKLIKTVKQKSPYKENYGDTSVYDEKMLPKIENSTENKTDI